MEIQNFKINKLCPFCPQAKYAYFFKTWNGLLRHVERDHLRVISKQRGFEYSWWRRGIDWKEGDTIYIRAYLVKYSKFYDFDIKNKEECYQLLYWYVTDNPSFKGNLRK